MKEPVVSTQMLIRRPVAEVFNAFADPAITTNFWFTKSTGGVEQGARLQWEWEMYGASVPVVVREVVPDRKILIDWREPPTAVEWTFEPRGPDATLVRISNRGFSGTDDEVVATAIDSMGGFTYLLASAKAFLEHGLRLELVRDHQPDAHVSGEK